MLRRFIALAAVLVLTSPRIAPATTPPNPAPAPSAGLPGPPYPMDAMKQKIQGTVVVKVVWDGDGDVDSCRVVTSSGSELLDRSTVAFIKAHWVDSGMAGKTIQTPIAYQLQIPPPGPADPSHLGLKALLTREGFSWTAGLDDTGDAVFYVVKVNGKPFNLRLATAWTSMLLFKDPVLHAGLRTRPGDPDPLPPYEIRDGSPPDKLETLDATSVQVGSQTCIPSRVQVGDFPVRSINGMMAEGHLGLDFLKANHAVILINPPLLFLNPQKAATSALDAWLKARGCTVVNMEYFQRQYFLPVHLDGYPARMSLTAGEPFTILKAQLVNRDHFAFSRGRVSISQFEVGNFPCGSADLPAAWTVNPDEQLPNWNYESPSDPLAKPTQPGDWRSDGDLGYDLLGSVYTIIDCSSNRIYFRAAPQKK